MNTTIAAAPANDEKKSRDRRAIWMFFSSIWVFFMVGGLIRYWRLPEDSIYYESLNVGHKMLATLLVAVFIGVYLYTMYRTYYGRDSWFEIVPPRVGWLLRLVPMGILVLILLLPNAESTDWRQGFVFVVIIWALTSRPEGAVASVFQAVAIAAIVLIATGNSEGGITGSLLFSLGFGMMVAGSVMNNGMIGELMVERGRVRDQAVTEERFRLARDLHDTVGHSMTQITLKAELARRILDDYPARAAHEIDEIEQLARKLSQQVRKSIAGETEVSLSQEVSRAEELLESMGIECIYAMEKTAMPPEVDGVLAWCLREAVMNVAKHSGATRCEIELRSLGDEWELVIRDNGSNSPNEQHHGKGLQGMKERVQQLNGEIQFSVNDSGHSLAITIPA